MAATDVIFRIGTMGISKAQAELGVLVSALYKVGKAVAENVKKADEFSDAWSRLSDEQKRSVQAMDTATKGWISTMSTMSSAGKLGAAGIKPTSDEMKSLALVAADTAKKLGEGPEGAARRLEELTAALIKGSDRGLKPYGIELKSTGTLSEKQAEAFAKLTERANGLTIELDGLDDKFGALKNTIDKNVGLTYNYSTNIIPGVGSALDFFREKIDIYNTVLTASNGKMQEYIGSFGQWTDLAERTLYQWSGMAAEVMGWADALEWATEKQHDLNAEMLKNMGLDTKYKGPYGYGDIKAQGATQTTAAQAGGFSAMPADTGASRLSEIVAAKPKGGGGGRPREPEGYAGAELPGTVEITDTAGTMATIIDLEEESKSNLEAMHILQEALTEKAQKEAEARAAIVDYDRERYQLIMDAMMEQGPWSVSNEESQWAFDYEYAHAQRMLEIEWERAAAQSRRIDIAHTMASVILDSSLKESAANHLIRTSFVGLRQASTAYLDALITGSIGARNAFKMAVAEVLRVLSAEMAVQAVVEAARAIMAAAKRDYSAALKHTAAAGLCTGASIAAGLAANRLGAATGQWADKGAADSVSSASGGGGGGGGGSSFGEGYAQSGEQTQEIVLHVDGSMANLFSQMSIEAKKQKKSGAYEGGF